MRAEDVERALKLARECVGLDASTLQFKDGVQLLARAVIALHEELELQRLRIPDDLSSQGAQRRARAGSLIVKTEDRTAGEIADWLRRKQKAIYHYADGLRDESQDGCPLVTDQIRAGKWRGP